MVKRIELYATLYNYQSDLFSVFTRNQIKKPVGRSFNSIVMSLPGMLVSESSERAASASALSLASFLNPLIDTTFFSTSFSEIM